MANTPHAQLDGLMLTLRPGQVLTANADGTISVVTDGYPDVDRDEQGPKMSLAEMAAYLNEPNDILNDTEFASVDGDYGTTDGSIRRETVSTEVPREKALEMFTKPHGEPIGKALMEAEDTYMAFVEDALERINAELRGAFYEMTYDERFRAAQVIKNGRALVFVEIGEKED